MSVRGKLGVRPRSNVLHWAKLQEADYFESHPWYLGLRDFGDEISLISNFTALDRSKIVVVIGCGYGRETAQIAPRVRHVYGIDVSGLVLDKAFRFLKERHISNFTPVFAQSYQTDVPAGIDLVFSNAVMQHLTRDLVFDYFLNLGAKLAPSGMFVVQFLEELVPGAASADAELKVYEPSVSWTIPQLCDLSRTSGLTFQEVRTFLVTPTALWHWVCFTKPSLPMADLAASAEPA